MGLFGSKLRIPMRNMLPPDTEDTPATYPAMQVKDSGPTPVRPKGLFGGSYAGPQLNKWQVIGATLQQLGDNRGQLNDLYQMEDRRQRAAFEQQRQQEMTGALANDPNIPESVRGFLPYAPEAVLSGVVSNALKPAPQDEWASAGDGVIFNKRTSDSKTIAGATKLFNTPDGVIAIDPVTRAATEVYGVKNRGGGGDGYRLLSSAEAEQYGLPPGAYQISGKGKIDPIATRGADAAKRADTLRDDYRSEPVVKNYVEIDGVYNRSKAYLDRAAKGTGTPMGDIGLVFALAKINDPTSVVREQEFATVANAGGYGDRVKNLVSQAMGRGFDPKTRAALWAEIQSSYGAYRQTFGSLQDRYRATAQRNGLDPQDIFLSADAPEPVATSGGTLPPPKLRVNGMVYPMKDGSRARWDARTQTFEAVD